MIHIPYILDIPFSETGHIKPLMDRAVMVMARIHFLLLLMLAVMVMVVMLRSPAVSHA